MEYSDTVDTMHAKQLERVSEGAKIEADAQPCESLRPGDPCGKKKCTGYKDFGTTLLGYFRCVNCNEFAYPSLYVEEEPDEGE